MSDLVTERTITRAFYDELRLFGTNVIVGCVDGVVTLTGGVNDASQAALAGTVARRIEGFGDVRESITTG